MHHTITVWTNTPVRYSNRSTSAIKTDWKGCPHILLYFSPHFERTDIFCGLHTPLNIRLMGHKTGLVGAATTIRFAKRKLNIAPAPLAYLRHILHGITVNIIYGRGLRCLNGGCPSTVSIRYPSRLLIFGHLLRVRKNANSSRLVSTLRDSTQNTGVSQRTANKILKINI
jgi:hypothetical protein